MEEKYAWKTMDYNWPSDEDRDAAIKRGFYNPESMVILGIDRWRDMLFVTVPRWRSGVVSTLNYISLFNTERSPKLEPYPSWDDNSLETEHTLSTVISAYRLQVDHCDRLWVVDNGLENILEKRTEILRPAIVIFDLTRHQLLRRFDLPYEQIKNNMVDTFFANIVVDCSEENCEDAHAYIADAGSFGLIVYSFKKNKSWRIEHNFFHIDPTAGAFSVDDVLFTWTDGVFGVALGHLNEDFSRDVYFHSLTGWKEFIVSNKVLQNENIANNSDLVYTEFRILGDRGPNSYSTTHVFDDSLDVIFFTQVAKHGIACWNIRTPLNEKTVPLIEQDDVALIMPIDISLDNDGFIWVVSNRMPHFIQRKMNFEDFNFRVMVAKASDLIKGTLCDLNGF
ncbi:Y-f.2 family protein [Megaselia abdita]